MKPYDYLAIKEFVNSMDKEIEDKVSKMFNKDAQLVDNEAPIHDHIYYDLKIKLKILECLNELTSKVKDLL